MKRYGFITAVPALAVAMLAGGCQFTMKSSESCPAQPKGCNVCDSAFFTPSEQDFRPPEQFLSRQLSVVVNIRLFPEMEEHFLQAGARIGMISANTMEFNVPAETVAELQRYLRELVPEARLEQHVVNYEDNYRRTLAQYKVQIAYMSSLSSGRYHGEAGLKRLEMLRQAAAEASQLQGQLESLKRKFAETVFVVKGMRAAGE